MEKVNEHVNTMILPKMESDLESIRTKVNYKTEVLKTQIKEIDTNAVSQIKLLLEWMSNVEKEEKVLMEDVLWLWKFEHEQDHSHEGRFENL